MDEVQYSDVLQRLKKGSQKRDPRSVRLAAVTSALVEVVEGDDVTAAKVYARTVTALEGILFSETTSLTESLATQVALLELLATTLPFVTPTAIVSASLTLTSRVLRGVITASQSVSIEGSTMETKDELGGANAALRWTCKAATEVLKRLDGRQKNVDEKVIQQLLLGTLITCMEDRRPKVRKAAQNGVIEVLVMEEPHRCHSAVRKAVSSYAHAEIKKTTESKQNDSLGDLLHLLGFLDRAIPYLAYQKLGSDIMELATALFQVEESTSSMDFVSVKVGQATPKVLVISSSLSVISSLLENTDPERKDVLDGFAPRVLASLIQAKPSLIFRRGYAEFEILQKGRTVFGQALLSACRRVLSSKTDLGAKLLPLSVQMILSIATPNDDESEKNSTVAETLLVELTQLFRESLTSFIQSGAPGLDKCLNDCLHSMQQVISPSFLPSTSISLNCLAVLVQQLWQSPQVPEIIEGLIQCRKESAGDSSSQQAIDDAFSSIIQGVGIEVFWDWIQWNPDSAKTAAGGIRLDRAFILPTMKVAANTADAGGQKLAFFQSRILGLARECDKLAASSKEVKFHQARVVDLWSLLPCFCRRAVDIVASLPALTSVLKKALEDRRYPQLVLFISTGLVSLVVSSDGGGISTTQSEILGEAAVELLPVMFKIVALNDKPPTEDLKTQMKMTASEVSERSHQTQSLCEAIAALSRCAPTPFLHGLFKKLMQRLLEEAQSGISDSSKVCAFLCLCQSLVSSRVLDENSISFLYRALKPMIRNDEQDARIQKRAYKVLAEMCECHHSFFFDITRLQETIELLTGTMGTSQIAARHMRLKCMNIIIDGFDDTHSEHVDELMHVLAEILLCLKDPNAKTREAGYQLLLSIAMRKDMADFLQTVTAALGAETPHMRSAAVMALSRLVFEFGWEDESLHILLPSLLRTVLVLVNENSREVIKSTIGFIRISVAAIPAEQLEPVLPELLGGLLHYHKAKSRFRSKVKIILKKLIKLFGYDALTPYVPETETRLLTHMRKLEERQARRKAEAKAEGRNMDQFDEMFDSDEEDSDDGRTWMSGATGFTKLTARNGGKLRSVARSSDSKMSKATMASRATSTSASKLESSTRLPDETDGDVVDMLDSKFAKRVKFNDQSANSDSDGAMEFDDDGRLIVRDEGAVVALESMDEGRAEQQQKFIGNKRQRLGKLDGVKTKESDVQSKKSGKRGRELGSQYKSKKAGGDVRKKDQKFEPYAFVPLDGKSYSKKNRRGAVEQMSSVVRQGGKRKR